MPPFQRALITGASSGLGRALATWFARRGTTVYAAGRRVEQLEALRAEGEGRIIPFPLDVARPDDAHDAIARLDADVGLDLVVANAGVSDEQRAKDLRWSRVRPVLDVNVMGATATLCAALPGMLARGRGHLVGISSLAAFLALPKYASYNASKTFLTAWLENVRLDVEPHGVGVTVIHPGFVKSEMTAKNRFPMPFLLDTGDAAALMGRAIERRSRFVTYPWPTAMTVWLASSLPRAVQRLIARRLP
jgi:short-subunit dehydrogenase